MILTAPYWLLAASAILIPIAIHLWNKRQGKTVKIGSIRWLEASASKQWSSIRLTDVWLLLLRCAILVLLAFALAQPIINISPGKETGEKAIFISPELLYSNDVTTLKPTIDPLLLRGYSLYSFTPAFQKLSQEQWQQLSATPIDSLVEDGSYWQLMPAVAQKFAQPQDSVLLFTSDQQRHFSGTPPPLQENIRWIPVSLDRSTTWLQEAYLTGVDSVLVTVGESNRTGTRFSQHRLASKTGNSQQAGNLQVRLAQQQDTTWAYWGATDHQRTPVRKTPIQISVVANKAQQAEVKYLKAAIAAISRYTSIPVTFEAEPTRENDWIFWLTTAEVPDSIINWVAAGSNLWIQSGENPEATNVSLSLPAQNIKFNQLSSNAYKGEQVVWSATNGEPVLTSEHNGKGHIYFFRSGFSPEWSNLGQNAQIPDLLFPLLIKNNQATKYNAAALPEALLTPERLTIQQKKAPSDEPYHFLPWLVLMAFALFIIERLISSMRLKAKTTTG